VGELETKLFQLSDHAFVDPFVTLRTSTSMSGSPHTLWT